MTSTHRRVAMASLALTPLVLAGCEKPNPSVTAWSGTSSEHVEAVCWQREGGSLGPSDCAQDILERASAGEGVPRIPFANGDVIGISVDPVVADGGWSVQVGGQTLGSGIEGTYFRFTFPDFQQVPDTGFTMQVIAEAEPSGSRGFWFFQLVPR